MRPACGSRTLMRASSPRPGLQRTRVRCISGWVGAQGIRNPQAHPSDDITEQEALEQLAALSVLARWVDECDVDHADGDAAGE